MTPGTKALVDEAREIVERRRNSFAAEATYIIDKMIAALSAPAGEDLALADRVHDVNESLRKALPVEELSPTMRLLIAETRQVLSEVTRTHTSPAPTPSPDIAALRERVEKVRTYANEISALSSDPRLDFIASSIMRRAVFLLRDLAAALPSTGTD